MSDLTLTVGGHNYSVSCADGEEDRIRMLAAKIDGKLAQMGGNLAHNDAKNLLFAALMLADELHDAGNGGGQDGNVLAESLEQMAARLENLASVLEAGGASA